MQIDIETLEKIKEAGPSPRGSAITRDEKREAVDAIADRGLRAAEQCLETVAERLMDRRYPWARPMTLAVIEYVKEFMDVAENCLSED